MNSRPLATLRHWFGDIAAAPSACPPPTGSPPASPHQRRVCRMLLVCSAITMAVCLFWALSFVRSGNWGAVSMNTAAIVLSLVTLDLMRRGHARTASRLLIGLLYVLLCFCVGVLDLPTPQVPRSSHHLLLAVGIVTCLLVREESPGLRHGVPLLFLATYLVFSVTDIGWPSAMALPDEVRARGLLVNQGVALLLVYAALHVMQNDTAIRDAPADELREALMRGELQLHYQPQMLDAPDGVRVVGAEALARWTHPTRGPVSPAEFIPLAERSGLMLPLGDWVLRTACAQLASWSRRPETAALELAVNVSATQFARPDFVEHLLGFVQRAGIPASRLKLELTENMLAADLEDLVGKMTALKAHGIRFSLDDFGTGFSSLSYLRRLPLDQLKIDQSFTRELLASSSSAEIARTVVNLGRSLGLEVIAEGVETDDQRRELSTMGCDRYQGFLYSRALPVAEFYAFAERHAPSARTVDSRHA